MNKLIPKTDQEKLDYLKQLAQQAEMEWRAGVLVDGEQFFNELLNTDLDLLEQKYAK
ncbi:hypothetical protein [Conservatibacter flavescens]|uniref:hypothetical protein n=1 Tax=Conservatibacter flavescens TaxID=28161 RepID=UPI0013FDED0C|nr:hypothetical protein [Conservatibacter flavescens]